MPQVADQLVQLYDNPPLAGRDPVDTAVGGMKPAGTPLRAYIRALAGRLSELAAPAPGPALLPEPDGEPVALPEWGDYWLPDRLREYVIDRFGEAHVPLLRRLMAIVSRCEGRPADFAGSQDCRHLIAWLCRAAVEPEPERPIDVSIVLPVYNGLVFTLTCLVSLFATPTHYRFEVLIGDDGSQDGSDDALRAIGGRVRHFRNRENLGFLLNCNLTSQAARGRHLVLLNSDTLILPDWLDALVDTFIGDASIGLVGSKLLNGDGSLQEAGGIYWNDGSAWNYGHAQDPRLPEFNYVKEADYCSAAALAVPLSVWNAVDGFDPDYYPAYCEDADLAFRLRAAGFKTKYQPFSEIVHHEGKSHGRDTGGGIKSYQPVNMAKLRARFAQVLDAQHFANGESVFLARDRSRAQPHVLFIDHYVPQWDRDCGSRLMLLYVKLFLEHGFQATFWPDNLYRDPDYSPALQCMGVEVIYSDRYRDRFGAWLAENGHHFDYVFLSRPHIAIGYLDDLARHAAGAKILYCGHDLHWVRLVVQHEMTGAPELLAEIDRFRALEDRICGQSHALLFPSAEECDIQRKKFPNKTIVEMPVVYFDRETVATARARLAVGAARMPFHLMFVGGFTHPPNTDGILWFLDHVFPRLQAREPRFCLTIVGSNPPADILARQSPAVTVTGHISDAALDALYLSAAAAIVPLRYGGGVKGKLVEAFAHGIAVVSTTIGVQGIETPQTFCFVADEPATFADAVWRALTDPIAAEKAVRALDFLERKYSREAARAALAATVTAFR